MRRHLVENHSLDGSLAAPETEGVREGVGVAGTPPDVAASQGSKQLWHEGERGLVK